MSKVKHLEHSKSLKLWASSAEREVMPKRIGVNGDFDADWSDEVWLLWQTFVSHQFAVDEWCSSANYYTPRPYRNEYDRGSDKEGFVFVVQPGQRVCFWERTKQAVDSYRFGDNLQREARALDKRNERS